MTCSWQGLWGSSIIRPWIFCLFLIFFFWTVFPDIRLETTRAFKVPEVCDTLHQRNISADDPYSRHSPVSKYPGTFNHYLLYLYTVTLHVSTCMTWIYITHVFKWWCFSKREDNSGTSCLLYHDRYALWLLILGQNGRMKGCVFEAHLILVTKERDVVQLSCDISSRFKNRCLVLIYLS